jgi:hypothetical protein
MPGDYPLKIIVAIVVEAIIGVFSSLDGLTQESPSHTATGCASFLSTPYRNCS